MDDQSPGSGDDLASQSSTKVHPTKKLITRIHEETAQKQGGWGRCTRDRGEKNTEQTPRDGHGNGPPVKARRGGS